MNTTGGGMHSLGAHAATGHVAAGGGDVASRIGEHYYYCPGTGSCTPTSPFLGPELNLDTIYMTLIVMAILLLLAYLVRTRLSLERPRGVQNVLEYAFEFVNGFVSDSLGNERTSSIGPLAVALFLFILLSNWIGLLPIPGFLWHSPTSDLNTTLGLGVSMFILIQILAVRARHGGGYVKHFFEPYWWLFPINLIEELSKPITLSFRLFGNIFAGEVLILVFGSLLAAVIPALVVGHAFALGLGLFVGAIQAFIFTVLVVSYIGIATSTEGH